MSRTQRKLKGLVIDDVFIPANLFAAFDNNDINLERGYATLTFMSKKGIHFEYEDGYFTREDDNTPEGCTPKT